MNYQTELMQEILTNEKAQEMIDYVSQIYGDSYVGLWLFQVIGSTLGPIFTISANLREETSPLTTTLLLPYYEAEYGIQPDLTMTIDQRRALVIANMQSKGSCNPKHLMNAVSAALGGVPVEIIEKPGTNRFIVNVRQAVRSYAPAIAIIERMKPAHLIYTIQGVVKESATTDVAIGNALTTAEHFEVEVS